MRKSNKQERKPQKNAVLMVSNSYSINYCLGTRKELKPGSEQTARVSK